ncbi:MAG TPA: glycosyltransferase [Nannocystis sp.]
MTTAPALHASIVVRSYNRLPSLCELLAALLAQRCEHSFEIVVIEQSTRVAPADAARLEALAGDPRVRLLRFPPLGGPRARNVGVEAARGDIVALIDDDDLPEDDRWLARLLAAYTDPRCLGISGRQRRWPGDEPTDAYRRAARRKCLGFTPLLRLPTTFVLHDQPVAPVAAVHGTNGSIRRAAFVRFGGWDEDTTVEDESSFAYRAARSMQPGEYFAFDPAPIVVRGLAVAGGLDKRFVSPGRFYRRYLGFIHVIIGRYHPARVVLLYPAYVVAAYAITVAWLWGDSQGHRGAASRTAAALGLLLTLPWHIVVALWNDARAPRRPALPGRDSGAGPR